MPNHRKYPAGLLKAMRRKKLSIISPHPEKMGDIVTFRCFCGKVSRTKAGYLLSANTKSCGCLHGEEHGETDRTPEYKAWEKMRERCRKGYRLHKNGREIGRKITVCKKWMNSYLSFLSDVGRRPSKGYSIDRINNFGNYKPGNVRWATPRQQTLNSHKPHWITWKGITLCTKDWEDKLGFPRFSITKRLLRGWPLHVAMTVFPKGNHKVMFRFKRRTG